MGGDPAPARKSELNPVPVEAALGLVRLRVDLTAAVVDEGAPVVAGAPVEKRSRREDAAVAWGRRECSAVTPDVDAALAGLEGLAGFDAVGDC